MKWTYRLFVCGLMGLAFGGRVAGEQPADPIRHAVEDAVARVKPALVRIQVVATSYQQGREIKFEASGSGVIITKDGYLITNHHVAGHATRLVCILSDNEEIDATLVGTDPLADIAVLKLNAAPGRQFVPAKFGDSDALQVGDTVLAMGSPLALSQSVTLGIVSNTKMIMPSRRSAQFTLDGEDVGSLVRWIGHDAEIFPGNSGGPLVNLRGDVVGINEISFGLSGAIPGNLAERVARQLIDQGKVSRSWLGLEIQPLFKTATNQTGALIAGIVPGSPAAGAGLESGDRLVRVAGKDLLVRFDEEIPLLNQMVSDLPVGEEIEIVVQRNGQQLTRKLRTAEREQVQRKTFELKQWGITVRDISALTAREMSLDSRDGVLVTSVRPGGPAGDAKPPVEARDVLLEINGAPVTNVATMEAVTEKLTAGQTKPVPSKLGFRRDTERLLTVVKVGLKELEDPGLEAQKAWLPVATQAITRDMAEALGASSLTGVRVTQVYSNSTAEKAGLRVGDLIVALDGETVAASQPGDEEVLDAMVRQYRIGATPSLTIWRGPEKLTQSVELVRSPKVEREMKKYRDDDFEFTARNMTFFDKVRENWPEEKPGALVIEVKEGGWAALGRLATGDIIVAVDDELVTDVTSLKAKMKQVAAAKRADVRLRVARGVHTLYLELEPNWDEHVAAMKP